MKKHVSLLLASLLLLSSLAACSSTESTTTDDASAQAETTETTTTTTSDAVTETLVFATMNIPYNDFYAEELSDNDVAVDAVSSATTSKWKNFEYTYSLEATDGSGAGSILGPKYPVQLSQELFDELSALGESDDYYVTLLDEEPTVYKEVSGDVDSLAFSAVVGGQSDTAEATYEMEYPSNWGDFEVHLSDLPTMSSVHAVEVVTDSGKSYGLRTLENIWSNGSELSWGLGFTEVISKGNALSSEHYADMQGQTITEIVYYVPEGTVTVPMDLYVPYFYTDSLFTVGELNGRSYYLDLAATSVAIDYVDGVTIPEDCSATFVATTSTGDVVDSITASADLTTISWPADLAPGSYSFEIFDASGKYMTYACSVVVQTDVLPVAFDASTLSFVAANGASDDTVTAYLAGVSSYSVTKESGEESTSYNVNENHGTPGTPLFTDAGTIDLNAVNSDDEAVFEAGCNYTITFTVTGYTELAIAFTA